MKMVLAHVLLRVWALANKYHGTEGTAFTIRTIPKGFLILNINKRRIKMRILEFIKNKGSIGIMVCFISLLCNQISAFAEEYLTEATQDALAESFTMRVCGTLEKADSESGKMGTFFVQNGESEIKFLMNGIVPDDKAANHFYMESRYLPDSTFLQHKKGSDPRCNTLWRRTLLLFCLRQGKPKLGPLHEF